MSRDIDQSGASAQDSSQSDNESQKFEFVAFGYEAEEMFFRMNQKERKLHHIFRRIKKELAERMVSFSKSIAFGMSYFKTA